VLSFIEKRRVCCHDTAGSKALIRASSAVTQQGAGCLLLADAIDADLPHARLVAVYKCRRLPGSNA
jgi:hypothetical protein